jgi:hypothetical protein
MKCVVSLPPESLSSLKKEKQTGPGYQVVAVQLKDGRRFDQRRMYHRGARAQRIAVSNGRSFGRVCESQALEFQEVVGCAADQSESGFGYGVNRSFLFVQESSLPFFSRCETSKTR